MYKVNPYHNALHAADVFASIHYFINNSELSKSINKLDTICTLIAGFGHDVGHPGLTNRYLIQSRDKIAIQYNDASVLENMHCSTIFTLMGLGNADILSHLSEDDWVICRKVILTMVLDTDLSRHFEVFTKFRTRASVMNDLSIEKTDDKILILSTALKCADIGHSAKSPELHQRWTSMVMEEFFNQGDLEKTLGLPVSMYCDRNNTDVPKSQAGFLRNICIPLYEIWCSYLKSQQVDLCLGQLRENYQCWDQNMKSRMFTQVKRLQDESL
jgi:3',5'-cyclic-nucleotide phosphodiesterase/cAMP-specific phosphodiesterase 4